jgi:NAD+ diphosphatase
MIFNPERIESRKRNGDDYAFVFAGAELLVNNDSVPKIREVEGFLAEMRLRPEADGRFFGTISDKACYAYSLPSDFKTDEFQINAGKGSGAHRFVLLRRYITELDQNISSASGYASHLIHWDKNSRYCGHCGLMNHWHKNEFAKVCRGCGNVQFPRISPAIIILIHKQDKILLAHNRRFPEGRYSVLAGFMEIGETIEQTAVREVYEECGIRIRNIEYVSSQSWPFPDSLMIGLTAEWESGEIQPDGHEIIHADWYSPDNFPSIPGHGTIARKLIDRYTKTQT